MAISGQEQLTIGGENQPTGSDSLFLAFNKTQNNFVRLFENSSSFDTFIPGAGIAVNSDATSGVVTITNTGVTSLVPGTGITLSSNTGVVTISASLLGAGGGGVTNVGITSTTLNVTNSPIISSGVISINLPRLPVDSNFAPGTYFAPTVIVDEYGRITSISNSLSSGTVTSVAIQAVGDGLAVTGGPVTTSGIINLINTGVTKINAGTGIVLSGSTGNITISSSVKASGTVSRVDIASNTLVVLNSPITQFGTINVELPNNISLLGNISANALASNTVANIAGNVNAGNLYTTGKLGVTGNANLGNVGLSGLITANGNVTGGNLLAVNNLRTPSVTVAGNVSSNAWGTTGIGFTTATATYTDLSTELFGSVANAHVHVISRPTIGTANAGTTITNAATFYIAGAPAQGNNVSITNPYALQVANGIVYIATTAVSSNAATGALRVAGGVGIGGRLNVNGLVEFESSANVSGNINVTNTVTSDTIKANLIVQTVSANITAGENRGDVELTSYINVIKTATSSANIVSLPAFQPGTNIKIVNTTANNVIVYAHVGGIIDNLTNTNTPYTLNANNNVEFTIVDETHWYSF